MDALGLSATLSAELVGRYVVEREIGAGGMASVYLAHDVRHDRRVALKVLRSELAAVIGAERFLAEIRTTAKLQHPGILPLFDSGEAAGQLFYVMPYVEGESLRHRIARERQLPVADAVRLAIEAGEALAYAHDHQVIHRDIKPENILLQGGRAVLADFGIALAVQEASGSRLTQTGLSLGTPQYMSPEQAAGERGVDGRADQYALAAVLYEMLAGDPPFTAPTTQALIARVMTEDPRPLEIVRKSVPSYVAAAVHRALEKLPADRFATMREFVTALDGDAVRAQPRSSYKRSAGAFRQQWIPIGAAALLGGAAIGAAVDRATHVAPAPVRQPPITFSLQSDSAQRLSLVCCGNIIAVSPDGRRIAYQARDADSSVRVHVRDVDNLASRSLAGTDNPHELFFSPDGQQIGFTARRTLQVVDLRSGRVRPVVELPPVGFLGGGTWTDDGRILYAVGNTLYVVSADGGAPTTVVRLDSAKREFQIGGPRFVPGADLLLFSIERAHAEPLIRAIWLKNGKTKDIALGIAPAVDTVHHVLLAARSDGFIEARRFNSTTGDTAGPVIRVGDPVTLRSPVLLYAEYDASATGTIVTVSRSSNELGNGGVLRFLDATGHGETHAPPFSGRRVARPRFSPDGKQVIAIHDDGKTRVNSIFVYDPDRRATTPLQSPISVSSVDWVDADSVMSIGTAGETFVQSIHGGQARRIGTLQGWNNTRQLSVRGKWITFDGDHAGSLGIGYVYRDSIDRPKVLMTMPATEALSRLSPDGHYIAYVETSVGRGSVRVASFPSLSDQIVIANGVTGEAGWRGNGTLYYLDADGRLVAVTLETGDKLRVKSRTPTKVTIAGAFLGWDADQSGKGFVFGSPKANASAPPSIVVMVNAIEKR